MISPKFQAHYDRLNTQQREAVDALEGPVMVVAGPGTGKTNVLTLRIAAILQRTDTPPEAILAITFTESGVTEMKRRLIDLIGAIAYRVTITTFHAYCNAVLQEFPDEFPALVGAVALHESDQALLIQRCLDMTDGISLLRPQNAPDFYLKACISSISRLKQEAVTPDKLEQSVERERQSILNREDLYHVKGAYKGTMKGEYKDALSRLSKITELAVVYRAYEHALRTQRLYDYNDMIMEVARALETNTTIKMILQERCQYILVDEHQDTNNAQNIIIEKLADFWQSPNLFVVGDAKQAIYRFQGASLENFHALRLRYPDLRLIFLRDNYRSTQRILDTAEQLSPSERERLHSSGMVDDAPIHVAAYSTPDVQYWSIAQRIQQDIKRDISPSSIAVITRDNADAVSFAAYCAKLQIPYTLSTQQNIFENRFMQQLLLILRSVARFGDSSAFLAALHAPIFQLDMLDLYKLAKATTHSVSAFDIVRSESHLKEAGVQGSIEFQSLYRLFSGWSRRALEPNAASVLERVVEDSGLLKNIVTDAAAIETLNYLHVLYDMVRSHTHRNRSLTLRDVVEHLDFLESHRISLTSSTESGLTQGIRICTAHKSKGLEFDCVYIIDAHEGHWGSRRRRQLLELPRSLFVQSTSNDELDDEDERNLFYVALTRARRSVLISYSTRSNTGTEQLPSQFVLAIRSELVEDLDVTEDEHRWLTDSSLRFQKVTQHVPMHQERAYLKNLFREQGLSVTALNNYLQCPWKYFYVNLLRIPEAPTFALMYGSALDTTLERFFNEVSRGVRPSKQRMLTLLKAALRSQAFTVSELRDAGRRAEIALRGYFDHYHASWHANIKNQVAISSVKISDDIVLHGKIDCIEYINASTARVIDYKTGKVKSRNQILGRVKNGDGNYFRQLVFYKLLLDRAHDGLLNVQEGVIDFVEPDESHTWHRERFDITGADVRLLQEEIERVSDEIISLAYWNRRCEDSECRFCALRALAEDH